MNNIYVCASNDPRIPDEQQPSYCINFVVAKNRYYAIKLFHAHNNLYDEDPTTCNKLKVVAIASQILANDSPLCNWLDIDNDKLYRGLPTRSFWSESGLY